VPAAGSPPRHSLTSTARSATLAITAAIPPAPPSARPQRPATRPKRRLIGQHRPIVAVEAWQGRCQRGVACGGRSGRRRKRERRGVRGGGGAAGPQQGGTERLPPRLAALAPICGAGAYVTAARPPVTAGR